MSDLSHWNIVVAFKPEEAAALAVGLDPSLPMSSEEAARANLVLREIFRAHSESVSWCTDYVAVMGFQGGPKRLEILSRALDAPLLSVQLRAEVRDCFRTEMELSEEFKIGRVALTFDRPTLHSWFARNNFQSKYDFVREPIETTPASRAEVNLPVGDQERRSLYKLVIGMAMDGYKYNPTAKRNDATSEIANGLQELGIGLDVDTVRNWLQRAAAVLPDTPTDA